MRISDWSSDVCSSDLARQMVPGAGLVAAARYRRCGEGAGAASRLHAGEPQSRACALWRADGQSGGVPPRRRREIGRASGRERVSVSVALGGRRIIKKKKNKTQRRYIESQTQRT